MISNMEVNIGDVMRYTMENNRVKKYSPISPISSFFFDSFELKTLVSIVYLICLKVSKSV